MMVIFADDNIVYLLRISDDPYIREEIKDMK